MANDSDAFGNAVNFRLEHFSATGVFVSSAPLPGGRDGSFGIAFDTAANVWVSGGVSSGAAAGIGIWKFNPSASAALGSTFYFPKSGLQAMAGPLALDAAGNAWVAAAEQTSAAFTYQEEIFELSPSLALLSSSTYQRGGGLDGALWTAVDASSGVWAAGVSSNPATGRLDLALWKYDLSNRLQPGFPVYWPDAFQSVNALDLGLAVNRATGRVWIATRKDFATCAGPEFALLSYDLSGVLVSSGLWHGSPDAGALGKALAFDSAGNVWAVGQSSSATALWQFSPAGVLAAGYPQTGPYNSNAVLLTGANQVVVLSGDQPTLFQLTGTLAGAAGPGACAQAAAGPAHLAGTLTYAAGFAAGAVVNVGISSASFLGNAQPAFFPFTTPGGPTLSYSIPVAAPSTYSVVATLGDPNMLTPGSVVGVYKDYAAVAAAPGSTTSAVDFQLFPDTTPPTSALASLVSGSTLTALATVAGTAADDFGAGDILLAAQDLATGRWWDSIGGQWIATTTVPYFQKVSPLSSGQPDRFSWSQDVSSGSFSGQSNFGGFAGFLVNGHQYRLFVEARDFVGNVQSTAAPSVSFLWNGATGAIAPPPPPFVQGFALGQSSISWSWGAVSQAASYNVYSGTSALLGATAQTGLTQTGLTPSSAHVLCVAAVNSFGTGPQACSSAAYTLPAVPGAATFVSVTSTTIALSWSSSGNDPAAAYQAVLATAPDKNSIVQTQRVATTTAAFTSLFGATTYYVTVAAFNGAGQQSDYAPLVSTRTLAPAPGPVMNIAGAALGISSIAWTWSAAPYASSYVVFWSTTSLGATSTTSFYQVGLATATQASICVQGVNAQGGGPANCGAPAYAAAAAPGALSFLNVGPQGFTVLWDTRGNDATVAYEVSLSTDGFNVSVSTPGPFSAMMGNALALTGLTPGATYFVRVRAQNAAGLVTDFSPVGRQRTFFLGPNAPTLLSAQPDAPARLIRLSWQPAAAGVAAASYLVYRGVSPDTATFMTEASTPTATLSDLIAGSATYYYQVVGVNADGVAGARSAVVAAGIDVFPPQRVGDLRITAQRSSQGQADLAWTAPADDFSGVSRYLLLQSPSFMFDSPTSTTAIPALAPGATVTYTVSAATTQAVYFAVRSVDGQGNVSVVSNAVLFDPVPPVVGSLSLYGGQVVSRPMSVNASASDNVAVTSMVFLVDGSTVAGAAQGFLSFLWDTRALADGLHTVEVDAYDAAGNKGATSLSVTASYAPPSPPQMSAPAAGFSTKVATITVSGTSDSGVGIDVQVNGLDAATTTSNGYWTAKDVPLGAEGSVSVTAVAFESRGFSAPSAAVTGLFAVHAPTVPVSVTATAQAGGQSLITWAAATSGTRPAFYRVYRSTDDLTLLAGSSAPYSRLLDKLVGDRITVLQYADIPAVDGLYFYGVTAVDGANEESALSALVYALTDRVPPTAAVIFSTPQPVGLGTYTPAFQLSKVLARPPIITFTPAGAQPIALNLTPVTATLWRSTISVTANMGRGTAQFAFQGTDLAGNVGLSISSAALAVNTIGPTGRLSLSKTSPLSTGALTFSLSLDEPVVPTPTLAFVTALGSTIPVALSAASSDSRSWQGTVTITTMTGDGLANAAFSGLDPQGNSAVGIAGPASFVIKTVAPGAPLAVHANPGPGGQVFLTWSGPLGELPAYYNVYRDGVRLSTRVVPAADRSGSYTDVAPEGLHSFQVSSLDLAGNESALTDPTAVARATPPAPPVGLSAAINGFGQIQLTWQAGSTDTARFNLYRSTYATAASPATLLTRNSLSPFIDSPSFDARFHYVATALDSVGNESAGSAETVILYANGAPSVSIQGVKDGAFYNAAVRPTYAIADFALDTGSVSSLLDGRSFVSGSAVATEGAHTLVVSAANLAGHYSTATASFTIDLTPPQVSFSVANGSQLSSSVPISIIVTPSDLNLDTTAYTLANQTLGTSTPYNSGDPITLNGRYALTAVATDKAGNSTTTVLAFSFEIGPLAPKNLSVQVENGARVSWTSPEPDVVAYRVYRDGARISSSLLSDLFFFDAGYSPAGHVYEVSAVDAKGVEGARARATVPPVTLGLNALPLTRGFFDALHPTVQNASPSAITVGPAFLTVADALGNVAQATAPAVAVGPNQAGQLEGVIATPVSLGAATLRAVVALPTDGGSFVTLAGNFPIQVVDPLQPFLEVFPNPLVPGTISPAQVRLYNRGTAPMDIVTAQIANSTFAPVNNVQVRLLTPEGTLFAQAGLMQTANGANGFFANGQQSFFVTVPPNSSYLFDPVNLFVPNTIATNLQVQAVVSTPTFNLPSINLAGTRSFSSLVSLAVVQQVSYTATAFADQSVYDQGSTVTISGRSLDLNGIAVPNSSVTVHILSNGFERQFPVVTDSSANYRTQLFTLPNEAGSYSLYAAHPSIVSHAPQSSFTIVGLALQYPSFIATLAQNSTVTFPVDLTNTGATTITGLARSGAASANGVTLTIDPASLPSSLAPGAKTALGVSLAASPTASSTTLSLSVVESHGFVRTMPVSATIVPATVIPAADPQFFEVGMQGGQTRTQLVTLQNKGFATWRGVYLSSPTLDWVHIRGLSNLGDIPPGGNASFTISVEPPFSLPNGSYAQNPLVQVFSLNADTISINVGLTITSSKNGAIGFNVINADKPRGTNGQGFPVPGAVITLTSLDIAGLTFNLSGDANGLALLGSIPAGKYAWTCKVPGFNPESGNTTIDPGLTKSIEVIMQTATVTYDWSVTPTSITDVYDVALKLTLKTDVPEPALVTDPPMIVLEQAEGQTSYAQYTLTNKGLISAFNIELTPETPDPNHLLIEPAIKSIPELKPQQSVVVPLKITTHSGCLVGGIAAHGGCMCAAGVKKPVNAHVSVAAGQGCTSSGNGGVAPLPASGYLQTIVRLAGKIAAGLNLSPASKPACKKVTEPCSVVMGDCQARKELNPDGTETGRTIFYFTCTYTCCGKEEAPIFGSNYTGCLCPAKSAECVQ